jgi:hypothetical protein
MCEGATKVSKEKGRVQADLKLDLAGEGSIISNPETNNRAAKGFQTSEWLSPTVADEFDQRDEH